MFEMKSNSLKKMTKFVVLVPTLVLFAACASKEIKNASLEPLDLPADETSSYSAPETYTAPAAVKKTAKKSRKGASKRKGLAKRQAKKAALPAVAAAGTVQSNESLPTIGDGSISSAPIAVPPMAPPVPFSFGMETGDTQPNWLLAAFVIGGIVVLTGLAFRMRRQSNGRKRKLVYNA